MSSQCKLPVLPASACTGEAAHTDTSPSHCAVMDLAADPVQDPHPCPEQTFQADPCLRQGAATCLDTCPQVGPSCPAPAVPVPAWDSCASPCVGAYVCPAVNPCDPPQSKGGTNFPLEPTASPVEPCTPESVGTCVETFPVQYPTSAMDPCTLETVGTCVKTFPFQHTIPTVELCPTDTTGPCVETFPFQQAISPVEPCIPETVGTCMENIPLQHPASTVEPCTLEVLETCTKEPCGAQGAIAGDPCPDQCSVTCLDPCTSQSVICTEPCVSQSTAEPPGTCTAGSTDTSSTKGTAKGASTRSARAPFRLNTRTAAIVERCLSRCQNWLRGKK
ncbi:uncharacterized protein LOC116964004 [Tyto alba]|uniref:uncharacterized protein LOC116964004 n=1 Tax=Tyto alba TaxID=56313 RepID=UPI001C6848F7|nr:uncharacterized protein LOC116964004 [Tyto alba]XP_042641585.1 uncharacterized protein LOC116964004 [Tyto alba]